MSLKLWRKPLDADRIKVERGRVFLIEERCKGCGYCIEFCPEKVLGESKDLSARGYHIPVIVKPDNCVNCGLCTVICPDFAIFTEAVKES